MKTINGTRQSGFTLIELLVVISIIGVLSAIVLATLQTAKQNAKNAYTQAETRQIQNQLTIYFIDHGGYPNPTGLDYSWYCIGSPSVCVDNTPYTPDSIEGMAPPTPTVEHTLALNLPKETDSGSLWSLFQVKTAEAASTDVFTFKQFYNANMINPVWYVCITANTFNHFLCDETKAWVIATTAIGNTLKKIVVQAGETGTTIINGKGGIGCQSNLPCQSDQQPKQSGQ